MVTVKTQNTKWISLRPRASGTEIHDAITDLSRGYSDVKVMAGSLGFVTPRDLCGLRALVDHAARNAETVQFDCPNAEAVHRYLGRMGFFDDLPDNVALSLVPPQIRATDRKANLIELRRIDCDDAVEQLAERTWNLLRVQFADERVAKACATAVASATENVLDHAKSPVGALVAAQRYRQRGILELAVVDLGLGIPTTLRTKPEYLQLTDIDAVQKALEQGVTSTTGDAGRGQGLTDLVTTVRRAGSSTLVIQSGRAHITVGSTDEATRLVTPSGPVPGTWLVLTLKP